MSRGNPPMCFLFEDGDDLVETVKINGADAVDYSAFQRG